MNPILDILNWFHDHMEDIWASIVSALLVIEGRGGIRGIWSRVLGPKPPQAEVEQKQETKIV